jgi:UDP-N-acetylglucosamine 2-epimerase (non-hydrolysing)
MTILGTRPEIIRLCLIIKKIDGVFDHVLVHTGQNYAGCLNNIFFKELHVRKPDYMLGIREGSFGAQIGKIISAAEKIMIKEKPDRLLILGDTNSGLAAVVAKRLGIPVYHMEAGNRCYDDRVPEEINRRIIDHSSDVLMPYTHRSKENLLREGIKRENIFVIGNPIYEVLEHYKKDIDKRKIFQKLRISKGEYFLVTMHRAENVDDKERLGDLILSLDRIAKQYKLPILCSLHPRTRDKMNHFGFSLKSRSIHYLTPLGFFDFVALERNAYCVLSDSGTVQEECCIFRIPNVTIRDVTERPETIECGSNLLSGSKPQAIMSCVDRALGSSRFWNPPSEYLEFHVSDKVIKILSSYK